MSDAQDQETHRLLGTMIAKLEGLEKRMDRSDSYSRNHSDKRDIQIKSILDDVEELKLYMIENKGGKKMLIILLTAAGGLGAFITEILQKLIHFR